MNHTKFRMIRIMRNLNLYERMAWNCNWRLYSRPIFRI